MESAFTVPIHVDALFLDAPLSVLSATGRFDRQPYSDGERDYNSDIPGISEEIVAHAFQEESLRLKAGVHLHWALPDVLQRTWGGRIVNRTAFVRAFRDGEALWSHLLQIGWLKPIGRTAASIMRAPKGPLGKSFLERASDLSAFLDTPPPNDFPAVPNRWLITRRGSDAGAFRQWIVESDFLFLPGDGSTSGSVCIPYPSDPAGGKPQPFRFLGRHVPLEIWTHDPDAERLRPLTASGYGTPTFAAFYPNCHSVFGFHDAAPVRSAGLRYDVVGWYADADEDFLATYVADFKNRFPEENGGKRPQLSDILNALREDLGWDAGASSEEPTRSVYVGEIEIAGAALSTASPTDSGTVTISIGHTGTEALSAYLARAIDGDHKEILEDQIEAVQLASRLEQRRLDVGLKFQEARHARAFSAQSGGHLWRIRPESQADRPADATVSGDKVDLDKDVAFLLDEVNGHQAAYERAQAEVAYLRRVTFADWYKYMLAAYPPEASRDVYPDVDAVRTFLEKAALSPLRRRIREAGTLSLQFDGDRVTRASAEGSAPDALAASLSAAINTLLARIEQHNDGLGASGTKPALALAQAPAPRFWKPNEPVVLLVGDRIQPTPRYGRKALSCIVAPCEIRGLHAGDAVAAFRRSLRDKLDESPAWTGTGQAWTGEDWHPLLMEWEAEVFPLLERGNLQTHENDYDPTFITANYVLNDDACTLSLIQGKGRTAKGANVYRGQSILTPQSGTVLRSTIDAFLRKNIVGTYNEEAPAEKQISSSANPEDDSLLTIEEIDRLEAWYVEKYLKDADADRRAADGLYTAIRAYRKVLTLNCLSQALSGFNDALLMQKQTFQLQVADPLGFEDYRAFTEETVRAAVGPFNQVAPEPNNDFNPIRSGAMTLTALRLVDTFGRASKNLIVDDLITVEHMTNPASTYPVWLKPCFAQPMRLNFRFLAADHDDVEVNAHPASSPICGWVLPNYVDRSLMIYDSDGVALGSILSIEAWNDTAARWMAAPGAGLAEPESIANAHLRAMVARIRMLGPDFVQAFLNSVEASLDRIDPENFARHEGPALLLGRPLALVRAALSAQLKTPPAVHHGWNALLRDMQHPNRETNAFTRVRFPIRLGEHAQLNDGLVGYWIERDPSDDVFYAPQDEVDHHDPHLRTRVDGPMNLHHSVEESSITVSMLVDPRGSVHATTGILPTKEIALPPDHYVEALKRIQVTFFSTPLLTAADEFAVPLPDEPGYSWTWVEHDGDRWTEMGSDVLKPPNTHATFSGAKRLRDGWLRLARNRGTED